MNVVIITMPFLFILLCGLILFFKSCEDNRCNVLDNKKKVNRYVIDDKVKRWVKIKDNAKGWCICEFHTNDKGLNKELAELCVKRLEEE